MEDFLLQHDVDKISVILSPQGINGKARFFLYFGFMWSTFFLIVTCSSVIDGKDILFIFGGMILILFGTIYIIMGFYLAYGNVAVIIDKVSIEFKRSLKNIAWEKKYPIQKIQTIQEEMVFIQNDQIEYGIGISIISKFRPFIFGVNLSKENKTKLIHELNSFLYNIKNKEK